MHTHSRKHGDPLSPAEAAHLLTRAAQGKRLTHTLIRAEQGYTLAHLDTLTAQQRDTYCAQVCRLAGLLCAFAGLLCAFTASSLSA